MLSSWLASLFNQAASSGSLPKEMLQSVISAILKPGKDSLSPTNYWSISLLNTDIKMFAKVIACIHFPHTPCFPYTWSIRIRWVSYQEGKRLTSLGEKWISFTVWKFANAFSAPGRVQRIVWHPIRGHAQGNPIKQSRADKQAAWSGITHVITLHHKHEMEGLAGLLQV